MHTNTEYNIYFPTVLKKKTEEKGNVVIIHHIFNFVHVMTENFNS